MASPSNAVRFRGYVHPIRTLPHAVVSGGTPLIRITLTSHNRSSDVRFLIDTGADATVLHPNDAYRLLGDELYRIDFERDSRRIAGLGVGGGAERVVRDATLTLRSVDGESYSMEMPILIARPEPAEPGDHGNWRLPSLLGRDFLRHFRFELFCGERREAALETL